MEEFKLIHQALEVANKKGCFTLGESYKIFTELEHLKKSYSFYKDNHDKDKDNYDKENTAE